MGMDPNQQAPGGENYPPPPPPPPPGGGYPPPPPGAGYAAPMGAYGIPPQQTFTPTAAPVPAGINTLFQKWLNVTTKPGVQSFVNEIPTANWADIWLALLGLGILTAISDVIQSFEGSAAASALLSSLPAAQQSALAGLTRPSIGTGLGSIIGVPIGFFIGVGILWLSAKLFGGTGSFLTHSYAFMLFYVPLEAINAVVGIVPFLGGLVALAVSIYSIVLAVFAVSATHHLSTGRSVAAVLLPAAIVAVLGCILIFAAAAFFVSVFGGAVPNIPTIGPLPTP